MDIFSLGDDNILENTISSTQAVQVTVESVQVEDRQFSGEITVAWWIAVILLLGVSIAAVVGGLIIKHKTDDSLLTSCEVLLK